MMEQKVTLRPIVVFDNDVTEEEFSIIPKKFDGDVVIHGNLQAKEISLKGNLYCVGNVNSYDDIDVGGDFYCERTIKSGDITVGGNFTCERTIDSGDITVGGNFTCERTIDSWNIRVNGDFICKGDIKSFYIIVGNEFDCKGLVETHDIIVVNNIIKKS